MAFHPNDALAKLIVENVLAGLFLRLAGESLRLAGSRSDGRV